MDPFVQQCITDYGQLTDQINAKEQEVVVLTDKRTAVAKQLKEHLEKTTGSSKFYHNGAEFLVNGRKLKDGGESYYIRTASR